MSGESFVIHFLHHRKEVFQRWGSRTIYSVLDQAFFSGSNFIVGFLLARWLSNEAYGVFSIAYSLFLFISGFPNSLVWEPMIVNGSTRQPSQLTEYFRIQIQLQTLLTLVLGLMFAVASVFLTTEVRQTFLYTALSIPFILYVWFYRQACYVTQQIPYSAWISFIYGVLQFTCLVLIKVFGILSPFSSFWGMAVASIGASLFASWKLNVHLFPLAFLRNLHIFRENWLYGKHILMATIASGISNLIYAPLIGALVGLSEAGAYRAVQNLFLPAYQIIVAVSHILLPQLLIIVQQEGREKAKRVFLSQLVLGLFFMTGYSALMITTGSKLIQLLYNSPYYNGFTWLLPALGLILLVSVIYQMFGLLVRAFKNPKAVFRAKFASAFFVIFLGIFLTWRLQLAGVVVTAVLAAVIEGSVLIYYSLRETN